jgi:hypothetical protein
MSAIRSFRTLAALLVMLLAAFTPGSSALELGQSDGARTPAAAVLRARLFDESEALLVSRDVWYGIECEDQVTGSTGSSGYVAGTARTDAGGLLRIELEASQSFAVARTLHLTLAQRDLADFRPRPVPSSATEVLQVLDEPPPPPRVRPPYAECEVPASFVRGELDLGRQVLHAPGSPAHFAALDDAHLCTRYLDCVAAERRTQVSRCEEFDSLLYEMVRRATPACEAFVSRQLELARREWSEQRYENGRPELALLTALRRIQRRPDPIAITVDTEHAVESTFPIFPKLSFALRNVDGEGAVLNLVPGLLHFGLDGVAATGEPLRVSRRAPRSRNGGGSPSTLGRGEQIPSTLAAAERLQLDSPGEYRLRVSLLAVENDANECDLRGRIALLSPEIRIILRPLHVRLSHAEHEQHLAWLRAIDSTKRIPILRERGLAVPSDPALRPASDWSEPAEDPEDRLYREGFRALPALFDALDDPTLDPTHHAWAVAMLWNLTGLEEAGYEGVGPLHARTRWPKLRRDGPILAEGSEYDNAPLDEARLARTIERWKRFHASIDVAWMD